MNEVIKTIIERRSIRSFEARQINEEELNAVLQAGEYAASGMGMQKTMMVAVQDPEIIAQMSKLNAKYMGMDIDPFYGAPTVVVVFADAEESATPVEDGSLVIGNMMLAAASIGVGSCWVHRAKEVFEDSQGQALKEQWGIPASYIGVGNCILGYAAEEPEAAPRREGRIVRA